VENKPPLRFWVEVAMAMTSGLAMVLTIAWRDWIEIIFRVDPDDHSGSLESLVVVLCAVSTVTFIVLARQEWRRTRPAVDAA
jgi:hypothetical protein